MADMAKVRPSDLFFGPWTFFCYEKKQHIDPLLSEIWSKAVNKSIKRTKKFCFEELVTLSSLISNSAARNEK